MGLLDPQRHPDASVKLLIRKACEARIRQVGVGGGLGFTVYAKPTIQNTHPVKLLICKACEARIRQLLGYEALNY